MDADKPKKPWYLRKRWIATAGAGLLWLLVLYPAGGGPMVYGVNTGQVEDWVYYLTYRRFFHSLPDSAPTRAYGAYLQWWRMKAARGDPFLERYFREHPIRSPRDY